MALASVWGRGLVALVDFLTRSERLTWVLPVIRGGVLRARGRGRRGDVKLGRLRASDGGGVASFALGFLEGVDVALVGPPIFEPIELSLHMPP